MAIRVIAQRRVLKIGKNPGAKKFVMRPELYTSLTEKKVFAEAATHSGISAGVIKAAWDAAGEVIRTWATEGHSVPMPGLGTMRFGVRSKALDEDGNVLKRVTSGDSGDIEDPSTGSGTENGSGSETGGENGSGTEVHSGSGIIPTPTDPEDDQPD